MAVVWRDLLFPGEATDFFARRDFYDFNPAERCYHAGNALWLAELSRLTYRNPPLPLPAGKHLPNHIPTQHTIFESTASDTLAMLVEFGGENPFAVLAFRGTAHRVRNIVTDLQFSKTLLDNGKVHVHEGFLSALDSVWFKIEPMLTRLTCPVFFTGHSLGAALATLAATRYTPTALYTFGSPRVGDAAFVASLSGDAHRIYRLVVEKDVVATLPPAILGFEHVGELKILHPCYEDVGQVAAMDMFTHPAKPLADHAPINYVDSV